MAITYCRYTKSDGTPCRRPANQDSDYCSAHITSMQNHAGNLVHGQNANPAVLGTPNAVLAKYTEFFNSEEPTNLRGEMAILRSVIDEILKNMERKGDIPIEQQYYALCKAFFESQQLRPEQVDYFANMLMQYTLPFINQNIPKYEFDRQTIMLLSDTTVKVAKIAETMKKIQDGFTLRVEIAQDTLVSFVNNVVFAVVKDGETRRRIYEKAMAFNERTTREGDHAFSHQVEEGEFIDTGLGDLISENN